MMTDQERKVLDIKNLVIPFLFFFPLFLFRVWKGPNSFLFKLLFSCLLCFSPSVWGFFFLSLAGLIEYSYYKQKKLEESCTSTQLAYYGSCVPFSDAMAFTDSVGKGDINAIDRILKEWIREQDVSLLLQDVEQIKYKNSRYVNPGESPFFTSVLQTYVLSVTPNQVEAIKDQLRESLDNCSDSCLWRDFPITSSVWTEITNPTLDTENVSSYLEDKENPSEEELSYMKENMASYLGWSQKGSKKINTLKYEKGNLRMVTIPSNNTSDQTRLAWRDGLIFPFSADSYWSGDYPEEPIDISVLYNTLSKPLLQIEHNDGFYTQKRSFFQFSAILYDAKNNQLWITDEHRGYTD